MPEKDYFFNFDDERLINFKVDDFQALQGCFIELFGIQHIYYFDEIQNVKGWEQFVRRLYDAGNKVFITGSNANMLSRELGTHLTGRYVSAELYPFSFKEYLTLKKVAYGERELHTTAGCAMLISQFRNYLSQGGFPKYISQPSDNYLSTLYESIIYKDVMMRNKLTNEREMLELMHFLASNPAKRHTYNSLGKTIGIKHPETIKNYLSYIEDTYLIFQLLKFDYSIRKQMANPKKIYFVDNALINKIGFNATDNTGVQLENLVFIELKRRGYELFYHSEAKECDFIVRQGIAITQAIQVTLSLENPETRHREISGLSDALNTYHLNEGYILTMEEEQTINENGRTIHVLPVWKWMLS